MKNTRKSVETLNYLLYLESLHKTPLTTLGSSPIHSDASTFHFSPRKFQLYKWPTYQFVQVFIFFKTQICTDSVSRFSRQKQKKSIQQRENLDHTFRKDLRFENENLTTFEKLKTVQETIRGFRLKLWHVSTFLLCIAGCSRVSELSHQSHQWDYRGGTGRQEQGRRVRTGAPTQTNLDQWYISGMTYNIYSIVGFLYIAPIPTHLKFVRSAI